MKRLSVIGFALASLPLLSAEPALFGLGQSEEGTYQIDTNTVRGNTKDGLTAWVVVTQATESKAKTFGAEVMLIRYFAECSAGTLQPTAWKAKNGSDEVIAQGIHGKEKKRSPSEGSMDERIFNFLCKGGQVLETVAPRMTMSEARKRIPELSGLSDESALNVIHEVYYPHIDKATLASYLGVTLSKPLSQKQQPLGRIDQWRFDACVSEAVKSPTTLGVNQGLLHCRRRLGQ